MRVRKMMTGLRVAGGLAVTVALAAGLLVTPRITRPVSAATSVRQALAKVNTWHLKGWKIQDGRQVPWEVWGRREPFFYRERVGGDIVLDDGRQRLSVYGPSRERFQNAGVFVRHPCLQGADNLPLSYNRMIIQWRDAGKPWKQTGQGPVFNFNAVGLDGDGMNTDHLYFVDGRTWLPTRYEKRVYHNGHEATRRTVALLKATYDMPVPASACAAVSPPEYRVVDALETLKDLPREGAVSAHAFTLHFQPLAMDRDGNVLVRLRGWLGKTVVPY